MNNIPEYNKEPYRLWLASGKKARLQYLNKVKTPECWIDTDSFSNIGLHDTQCSSLCHRIHPDDIHLCGNPYQHAIDMLTAYGQDKDSVDTFGSTQNSIDFWNNPDNVKLKPKPKPKPKPVTLYCYMINDVRTWSEVEISHTDAKLIATNEITLE